MPWIVAETIALDLATRRPLSVHVTRDPGARIRRQLDPVDGEPAMPWAWLPTASPGMECLLWVGDGCTASVDARAEVLRLAADCSDVVMLVEPLVPGNGLGLPLLRAIDPALQLLVVDEVTDGDERTRDRKPWEPAPRWAIATVRAWRFDGDAELARTSWIGRLPRMGAPEMLLVARRVLVRFPRAHEVLLLGVHELVRRGDLEGAKSLTGELELSPAAPRSLVAEARRAVLGGPPPVRATG